MMKTWVKLYRIPFQYPTDLQVTELRDLLNEHSVKLEYNFDADFDDPVKHIVSGTLESLISFHRDLDGPGQSFPVDEFKEYVEEHKLV